MLCLCRKSKMTLKNADPFVYVYRYKNMGNRRKKVSKRKEGEMTRVMYEGDRWGRLQVHKTDWLQSWRPACNDCVALV